MKGSYGRYALVGALFCAVVAAWLNLRFLESREEKVAVVMVVREIEPYTEIPTDAVRIASVPKDAAPADAVRDLAALQGHYSRALLIPGTAVRGAHLVPAGGSNLAARLAMEQAHDTRAMALQVNEATGVAGTLKEGDPVDVLVAVRAEGQDPRSKGTVEELDKQPEGTLARVIAQRVPVLFVQQSEEEGPTTVVLQVTPQTAEEIAFAQANGMIWLLTGSYGEEGKPATTTGVDQRVFFQRWGVAGEKVQTGSLQPQGAAGGTAGGTAAQPSGSVTGTLGGS